MSETSNLDDQARAVRAGEELDAEKLSGWLAEKLNLEGTLEIEQFPSGHSNLTYLLRVDGRELVLRRPPFGTQVKTAHDMGREFRVLSALGPAWAKAPTPLALCDDESLLGCTFYIVERVRGLILRRDPPPGLDLNPTAAKRLSEAFVDTLVELHQIDADAVGLGDLGRPDGYVERQVSGWVGRYQKAKTDDVADVERVATWLTEQRPFLDASAPAVAPTLLHNDFKYDNLVLNPDDVGDVRAVLDWEMSTRGDPLMDLGTALCYWVDAGDARDLSAMRFAPTHLDGTLDRLALAERYASKTGRPIEDIGFYYAFGLLKTAVVAQQIYARFAAGHTKDPRFKAMIGGVRALAAQAARVVDNGGRIDALRVA